MGRFTDLWHAAGDSRGYEASGSRVGFASRWDALKKHGEPPPQVQEELQIPEAQAMVIKRLQIRRQGETAKWLTGLTSENSAPAQAELQAASQAAGISKSEKEAQTKELLDTGFGYFEDYSYEFNQSALGTDLIVTVSRPVMKYIKTVDSKDLGPEANPDGRITVYEGALSTRNWTMVVRGRYDKVQVFLVPADRHLAFLTDPETQKIFSPFVELVGNWDSGKLVWQMYGAEIGTDRLKPICKELFGDLIRVSSGKLNDNELFAQYSSGALKLGENVAVGYQSKPAPQAAPAAEPTAAEAAPVDQSAETLEQSVHEACDRLDHALDEEVKVLYSQASKASVEDARAIRKHVEALLALKQKLEEGFHDYMENVPRKNAGADQRAKAAAMVSSHPVPPPNVH